MRTPRRVLRSGLTFVIAALLILPGAAPVARLSAAADAPKPMEPADILGWKTIAAAALSSDGKWLAYRFSPVQGDSEVIVRAADGDKEYRFPIGELPPAQPSAGGPAPPPAGGAGAVAFSEDAKWVAFVTYPPRKEAEKLRRQKKPVQTGVQLVNLETGQAVEYPKVRQFAFSGESGLALALHRHGPQPAAGGAAAAARDRAKGADLIVRDLATGRDLTIGGVSEFAFDKPGRRLAWTIDAEERIGNGVSVRDLASGRVASIDSGKAVYERPTWNEAGDALAVLKGVEDKAYASKRYAVVGATGFDDPDPRIVVFDPTKEASFPAGMTVSGNRSPEWTEDKGGLLFGISRLEAKDAAADDGKEGGGDSAPAESGSEDKPDLVLWHWKDGRLQSQQKVQEERDKRFAYLATWRIAQARFIRLADDDLREVTPPKRGRWAAGSHRRPYELTGALEGRNYQDLYAVDIETGERKLAAKQVRWAFGQSPDSTKLLFYDKGHFHVFDAVTGQTTNITRNVGVSFVNVEDDHNVIQPPVPPEGWAADSRSVLLSDLWDIWQVPVTGGPGVNLTGNGRQAHIRYDRIAMPDEKGIDLTEPQYFYTLGEWTKKGGLSRVSPGKPGAESLAWGDEAYGGLLVAKKAPRLAYTRETRNDFPDFHVADATLGGARRVTDGQSQVGAYAWSSGARLLDYTSTAPSSQVKGKRLQGGLYLPANYEAGKRYPTIVYIYEHLSDGFNRFTQPTAYGFNRSVYTSQGYAVLMPDITYTVNDPGMSAVWSVLPALKAAVATGVVDAARVGLQGHSWGGYQTSFLVTQTDAFRAAVAGAPLTNLVSMYSLVYKNTGGGNMAIFESSQGRFKGGYWDNWDAYVRNSPVAHATKVRTPLVIMHNDRDGAVDFTQGVEYYSTLRRLGKPVVMLEYVGENHNLVKAANRYDYTVRMREYFDHFLKGAPAPSWWTEGVPRLEMDEHLKKRRPEPVKRAPATPPPTAALPTGGA